MDIPDTGAVFTLGKSYLSSEDNHSYFFIKNDAVKSLIAGHYQSAVICESGRLFVWGRNDDGQLGIQNTQVQTVTRPSCVKAYKSNGIKIKSIAFGDNFSVTISLDNRVFVCGKRLDTERSDWKPEEIMEFKEIAEGRELTYVDIQAGNDFFIVLTSCGLAYGYGSNESNQISKTSETFFASPIQIDITEQIKQITCHDTKALYLTDTNEIYIFNRNVANRIEFDDDIIEYLNYNRNNNYVYLICESGSYLSEMTAKLTSGHFRKLNLFDETDEQSEGNQIKTISFGNENSLSFATRNGRFFTNYDRKERGDEFHEIKKFLNMKIINVSSGAYHVLAHALPNVKPLNKITEETEVKMAVSRNKRSGVSGPAIVPAIPVAMSNVILSDSRTQVIEQIDNHLKEAGTEKTENEQINGSATKSKKRKSAKSKSDSAKSKNSSTKSQSSSAEKRVNEIVNESNVAPDMAADTKLISSDSKSHNSNTDRDLKSDNRMGDDNEEDKTETDLNTQEQKLTIINTQDDEHKVLYKSKSKEVTEMNHENPSVHKPDNDNVGNVVLPVINTASLTKNEHDRKKSTESLRKTNSTEHHNNLPEIVSKSETNDQMKHQEINDNNAQILNDDPETDENHNNIHPIYKEHQTSADTIKKPLNGLEAPDGRGEKLSNEDNSVSETDSVSDLSFPGSECTVKFKENPETINSADTNPGIELDHQQISEQDMQSINNAVNLVRVKTFAESKLIDASSSSLPVPIDNSAAIKIIDTKKNEIYNVIQTKDGQLTKIELVQRRSSDESENRSTAESNDIRFIDNGIDVTDDIKKTEEKKVSAKLLRLKNSKVAPADQETPQYMEDQLLGEKMTAFQMKEVRDSKLETQLKLREQFESPVVHPKQRIIKTPMPIKSRHFGSSENISDEDDDDDDDADCRTTASAASTKETTKSSLKKNSISNTSQSVLSSETKKSRAINNDNERQQLESVPPPENDNKVKKFFRNMKDSSCKQIDNIRTADCMNPNCDCLNPRDTDAVGINATDHIQSQKNSKICNIL